MSDGVPQFARAEYSGDAGNPACKSCGQPISGAHYQINGAVTCSNCAEQVKDQIPKDSHTSFVRGVLLGIGGAILGLVLYVAVALTTGLIIGFVSLEHSRAGLFGVRQLPRIGARFKARTIGGQRAAA
jgi:hypothetical protein